MFDIRLWYMMEKKVRKGKLFLSDDYCRKAFICQSARKQHTHTQRFDI